MSRFLSGISRCINKFRRQAFKASTIQSAWRHTGLIPYNSEVVLQEVRDSPPPPRQATPEAPEYVPLAETPKTIRQLATTGAELTLRPDIPEELQKALSKFTRGSVAIARCGLLMEERLEATIQAENARRSRRSEANKVSQKGGVLYAKEARHMNRERFEFETQRAKEREAA